MKDNNDTGIIEILAHVLTCDLRFSRFCGSLLRYLHMI